MLTLQMSRRGWLFCSSLVELAPDYDPLLNLAIAKTREWREQGTPPLQAQIVFPDGKRIDLMEALCRI